MRHADRGGKLDRWRPIALGALMLGSLLALAVGWRLDRLRHWESPRLDRAGLVLLAADGIAPAAEETWLVAVHPACPHCLQSLARMRAARRQAPRWVRLAALIVDAPRRPPSGLAQTLAVDRVWWDSTGVWRRRWGHRIYGEVLRFDVAGRYWRTDTPLSAAAYDREAPALVWELPPRR
jgi:hypothetical protein